MFLAFGTRWSSGGCNAGASYKHKSTGSVGFSDGASRKFRAAPWRKSFLQTNGQPYFNLVKRIRRSSRLAVPHLPGPEQAKAGMMPGKDRFWLDDGQRRAPVMPEGQADPQPAVGGGQFQAFCRRSPKHSDWVAQSQVLELEGGTRLEDRAHRGQECREKNGHERGLWTRSERSRFPFGQGNKRKQCCEAAGLPRFFTRPLGGRRLSRVSKSTLYHYFPMAK
jgi:hypothetical protein